MAIRFILFVLLLGVVALPVSVAQQDNGRDTVYIFLPEDEEYPKFYMETEEIFERIKELPRDTVRDTIYVHRFEDFLKGHFGEDFRLSLLLQDIDFYQAKLDSIKQADPGNYQLFYNFFVGNDRSQQLSPAFVVSEVYLNPASERPEVRTRVADSLLRNWQKTVMFRLDDWLQTEPFLRDTVSIKRALVAMFNELKQLEDPQRLLIFLPEYHYTRKRDLVQFMKSVRVLMDATAAFKFERDIQLDLVLPHPGDLAKHHDVLYALAIECSHVGLFSGDFTAYLHERADSSGITGLDSAGDGTSPDYLLPLQIIKRDSLLPGFTAQLRSHYYIARFFPGSWDIREANLTEFTMDSVSPVLVADYQENYWEIYFFILVALFLLIGLLGVLYHTNLSFSMFVNNNMESALLISIVLVLEIVALVINIFQYMCEEDTFTLFAKNPILIFSFPLVVVAIVPILQTLSKKRRIPR